MNKLFITISWLTILSAMGILLVAGYWAFFPFKLVEFYNRPFEVTNEDRTVARGDRLRYRIDYCKYNDLMPEITKYFMDGVQYETPKALGGLPKGCQTIISDVYIPRAIPPGDYTVKIVTRYHVNPIRNIEFVNFTEKFTIK